MTKPKRSAVVCAVKIGLTVIVEGRVTKEKIAKAAEEEILSGNVSDIDLDANDVIGGYCIDEDYPG